MLQVAECLARASVSPFAAFEGIAERLAAEGWAVIPNFISYEWAAELLEEQEQQFRRDLFQVAGIGRAEGFAIDSSIRRDRICWLEQANALAAQRQYLDLLQQLRLELNQQLQLGLFEIETHAAVYPVGSFYEKHLDCFREHSRRKLTAVLYLNSHWQARDGGALRMQIGDEAVDVLPEAGKLVVFFSDAFYHQVMPTRRERHSITSWFLRRAG